MDKHLDTTADHLQVEQIDALIAAAGVDGAREIMDTFWRSTTTLLENLEKELGDKAFGRAAATAHAVRGSAANVGAGRLAQTTAEIETACQRKNGEEAKRLIAEAQTDFSTLREHFDAHLASAA